jgi:hypothetical protein
MPFARERSAMDSPKLFSPVTDADLERARRDLAFRQKLLTESLDTLLDKLQRLRSAPAAGDAGHIREGAKLSVRLAEMIQARNSAGG